MIIKAFKDVPDVKLQMDSGGNLQGKNYLASVAALQVGMGNKAFKSDDSGIWLGGNRFSNAPFKVDMDGNLTATSATITGYALDSTVLKKAEAGQVLSGDIHVGSAANVKIDGANARIVINDGAYDRVLIGYQAGGF